MAQVENDEISGPESRLGGCLLWFFGGVTLALTTFCSLVLLILVVASLVLNAYLGWELAGFEVVISTPAPAVAGVAPTEALPETVSETSALEAAAIPTPVLVEEVAIPVAVRTLPVITSAEAAVEAVSIPSLEPTKSPLEVQVSTLAAMATEAATPPLPTHTPLPDQSRDVPAAVTGATPAAAVVATESSRAASTVSNNSYDLIPLEGERDSRPAPQHADLSLKLREPQPFEAELTLIDLAGGSDSHGPKLTDIFDPNFISAYTIHNWDWAANRKTDLLNEVDLIEIQTTPGEPIFIPKKEQDIFQGKYYAVVLYATEDSLTFVYAREGTVANAYSVHYQGLKTDPNLLALYRQSEGNQLPGLTLDTPVGIATDKLIVAIRDRGKFMDVRSRKDWWQ